ncbi:MAG TPA: DUF4331 family protein [Polyangiaceae bacterium]|nr:DUF4331 family protein [Polyangiaceae bacterium]
MKRYLPSLSVLLAGSGVALSVFAADHGDAPAALNEPTADITDLYAWMTDDRSKLNLVLGVNGNAGASATFSDAVTYVFSVSSSQGYREPQQSTRVLCQFIDATNIECWAGNQYVVGNPSSPQGIVSPEGGLRVFAGLRDDPFFLDYTNFNATTKAAVDAVVANQVTFEAGCAKLTPEQQSGLAGLLTQGVGGNTPPSNTFAGQNILALVVQVDKSLVNAGGPVLGVSASTHSN